MLKVPFSFSNVWHGHHCLIVQSLIFWLNFCHFQKAEHYGQTDRQTYRQTDRHMRANALLCRICWLWWWWRRWPKGKKN